MIIPHFSFDADLNGYVCEPFTLNGNARVHIELIARAPVVTLKQEADGGFANYGQTPKHSDRYELDLHTKKDTVLKLATPVDVTKCFIINL